MAGKMEGQIYEIGGTIEHLAGQEVFSGVMEGSEQVTASSNPEKVALWVKDAMDRLDALTDKALREEIMLACGYDCILVNKRPLDAAKARCRKYPTEQAFMEAEIQKPPRGFRFERDGDILVQYYTPRSFGSGMRCFCGLMKGLPEGITASKTYCQCSLGFVQKYWEGILGRSVAVEIKETAISGADECKFLIHL